MPIKKIFPFFALMLLVANCSGQKLFENKYVKEAQINDRTRAGALLMNLPAPQEPITVSLYDFQDLTGQFKNNEKFTDYSSAVTKGGHAILTKALLDAGNKQWFTVVERNGLSNLLKERQIYEIQSDKYLGLDGKKLPNLPPLVQAGVLLEGGIVSYDSNIITGGAGAIYLGIGGNMKYNRDVVTVYLRATSVNSGKVLLSVNTSKTIFSTSVDSNVLKYVTFDRLLQAEAGFSVNEPVQLAVRQAMETAVYSMIMEGAMDQLWEFKNPEAGRLAMQEYLKRRDGAVPPDAMAAQEAQDMQRAMEPSAGNTPPPAAPAAATASSAPLPLAGAAPAEDAPKAAPAPDDSMEPVAPPSELAKMPGADELPNNRGTSSQGSSLPPTDSLRDTPASGDGMKPLVTSPSSAQPSGNASTRYLDDSAYAQRRKLVLPSEVPVYSTPAARH